jgi:hypothetical protein
MEPESLNNAPHPYDSFEGTFLWRAVETAIADLVANNDLTELTPRRYIIGHICKHVDELITTRIRKEVPDGI